MLGEKKLSGERLGEGAVLIGRTTADVRRAHDAVQHASTIRRDRVSVIERSFAHCDCCVRIPYDEVGVVPYTNVALTVVEARKPSRRTAHPLDELPRTVVPAPRSLPHRREPELQGRDATPSGEEVTVSIMRMLERG